MRCALLISEKILGITRPLTRIHKGLLAKILIGQGRFDESEVFFRQALAKMEEYLTRNETT